MNRLRKTADRLHDGSIQIGWRVGRWAWQDPHRGERAVRSTILLGLLLALLWLGQAVPQLGALLLATAVVKAFRAGEAEEEQAAAAEQEELPPPVVRSPQETLLRMILTLTGEGPGIHLDTLLDAMRSQPRWAAMQREDLRELLAAVRCPVRRSLRVGERTGIAGVHRDDAQAALDALAHDPAPLPRPGAAPDI